MAKKKKRGAKAGGQRARAAQPSADDIAQQDHAQDVEQQFSETLHENILLEMEGLAAAEEAKVRDEFRREGLRTESRGRSFLPDDVDPEQEAFDRKQLEMIAAAGVDVARNSTDPFGNGDQSFLVADLPSDAGQMLRNLWAQGMNFNPINRGQQSDLMTACYFGLHNIVESMIAAESGGTRTQLLNRRESLLRHSPLGGAICGTRLAQRPSAPQIANALGLDPMTGTVHLMSQYGDKAFDTDYVATARALLQSGADPDAKDVAGYSLVQHCCTCYGTAKTIELLWVIVAEFNGNPNVFNRFGDHPLHEAVRHRRMDIVDAFLDVGGRCDGNDTRRPALKKGEKRMMNGMDVSHLLGTYATSTDPLSTASSLHWNEAVKAMAQSLRPHRLGKRVKVGSAVRLLGLQSRPELNGAVGDITGIKMGKGRWMVKLRKRAPEPEPEPEPETELESAPEPKMEVAMDEEHLPPGTVVRVTGLTSALDLNGRKGRIESFVPDKGRYMVRFDGVPRPKGLKPDNLEKEENGGEELAIRTNNLALLVDSADPTEACAECGQPATKSCQGCLVIKYCCSEHQKVNWKMHKADCKRIVAERDRMAIKVENSHSHMVSRSLVTGKTYKRAPDAVPTKGKLVDSGVLRFRVKVMLPASTLGLLEDQMHMMVYNKDRTFMGKILKSHPRYKDVSDKLKHEGIAGLKGYFHAHFEEDEGTSATVYCDSFAPYDRKCDW